jgi:hypothetical protein
VRAAIKGGLVEARILIERLELMPVGNAEGQRMEKLLRELAVIDRSVELVFQALPSSAPGTVWVNAHLRGGRPVRGHWRGR